MRIIEYVLSFLTSASAVSTFNLDKLATVSLPKTFHRELPHASKSNSDEELKLSAEQRLKRLPYLFQEPDGDGLTFYFLQHDDFKMGGRDVPVVLRTTLYRKGSEIESVADYWKRLKKDVYYSDSKPSSEAKFSVIDKGVLYSESTVGRSGWLSAYDTKLMHFILTDKNNATRISFSVLEEFYSKEKALVLIRTTVASLNRDEDLITKELDLINDFRLNSDSIKRKNFDENLARINVELTRLKSPALDDSFKLFDTGSFVYGFEGYDGYRKLNFLVRVLGDGSPRVAIPQSLARIVSYRFDEGQAYHYVGSEDLYLKNVSVTLPNISTVDKKPLIIWTKVGQILYPEGFSAEGEIRVNFVGVKEEASIQKMVFVVEQKKALSYHDLDPKSGGEIQLKGFVVRVSGIEEKKITLEKVR